MLQSLRNLWNNYKYRFVPWISLNIIRGERERLLNVQFEKKSVSKCENYQYGKESIKHMQNVQIDHVTKDDVLISNKELRHVLAEFFKKLSYPKNSNYTKLDVHKKNSSIFHDHFGFLLGKRQSIISPQAGQGIFVIEGRVPAGSVVGLYPGTVYMPNEPLFFPSLGNSFIFRCSDNIHVDGNDRWISKSIYESCAARDQFSVDIPYCDKTWLTDVPENLLNVGQYVNNQSKAYKNNVVHQECKLYVTDFNQSRPNYVGEDECFPVNLGRFIPNVWSNPDNNLKYSMPIIPLVAVEDVLAGEELLSSYFTVIHTHGN